MRGGPGPGWLRVFAGVRRDADGEALRSETSERLEPLIIDVTDGETIAAAAERVREPKVQAVARRVLPHRALDRLVEREIDRA